MLSEVRQFDKWLRRKHPHTTTRKHYLNDLKLFFAWAGKPPQAITLRDVDRYIDHCHQLGHAVSTINRRLTALSTFYWFLGIESDDAPPNPVIPRRHFIPQGERLPRDVEDADLEQLLAVIELPRDRAMVLLMLRCGLRVGEVHRLSLGDLYLQPTPGSLPRLWLTGKRGAQRVAYLSPQALVALKNWLAVRPDVRTQAVFLSRLHRRISVRTIQDRLTRYCHRAGVDLSCHRLRHTFATQLLNAGCQVTSIQKLLGHKQLRSTMIYARVHDHTVAEHYYAAMATIEGHLDPVARSGQSDNVEQGQTLATRLDSAGEPMSIDEPARLLALIDRLAEPQLEPGARLALVEQMRGVLNYDQDLATTGNPIKMAIDTAA